MQKIPQNVSEDIIDKALRLDLSQLGVTQLMI